MVFYLYHYTNSAAADSIEKSKIIRIPTVKKGWFGSGIYLTSLPPSSGRKALLWNNYRKKDDYKPYHWSKTATYFRFSLVYLPTAEKMDLKDGRDLYVYRQEIDLLNTPYKRGLTDDAQSLGAPEMNSQGGGQIQPLPSASAMSYPVPSYPVPSYPVPSYPPAIVNVNYILPANTGRPNKPRSGRNNHRNRRYNGTDQQPPIYYQANEDDEDKPDDCCIIL